MKDPLVYVPETTPDMVYDASRSVDIQGMLEQAIVEQVLSDCGILQEADLIIQDVLNKHLKEPLKTTWEKLYQGAVEEVLYGYHDTGWLAFYDFWMSEVELDCVKPLAGLIDLAQACGWWAPYTTVAVVQCKHKAVDRDAEGNLHNESGPAAFYPDGWGVYCIHGVHVPKHVVMDPASITVEEIDKCEDVEVKRIMRERFGTGRYLEQKGAEVIDSDMGRDGNLRALWRTKDGKEVWLEGTDGSTARVYYMNVDPKVKTCKEAHESIAGFDEDLIAAES